MILAFAWNKPTWGMKLSGRPTCLFERAESDLTTVMRLKCSLHQLSSLGPGMYSCSLRPGNLPSTHERLPERPVAPALLDLLEPLANEVERNKVKDAVGASWAALATRENPKESGK